METGRVKTLNSYLKKYDPDLYADRSTDGIITVYRKQKRYVHYRYQGNNLYVSTIRPQWVTALTHNWSMDGKPVDWGIEPLLRKLKIMDQWRKDDALDEVRRHNEIAEKNRDRTFKNNVRAMAADARKDFAKATNDINTASLAKLSNRRKKDGTRK